MKRHLPTILGSRAQMRAFAEAQLFARLRGRTLPRRPKRKRVQYVGLKRWTVMSDGGGIEADRIEVRTPYAAATLRRRRAANKVAKLSRRRNRS